MTRPYRRPLRPRFEVLEDRANPVANDMFADAEMLTGQTAYVIFRENYDLNTGEPFTAEPGEPNHAGTADPIQSAWFRWTAPISGRATVMSLDYSFPPAGVALGVYTGDAVDALTEVASNSFEFGAFVGFDAVAGTTYSIAVDSPGDAVIDFDLYVAVFEPPANDNFADALVVPGSPAPVTVAPASSLSGSSIEPGEPNHAAGIEFFGFEVNLGPSVWYSWNAPTTGRVTLDLDLTYNFGETGVVGVDGAMAVYTGGTVDDLTRVANSVEVFGPFFNEEDMKLSFDVVAGTTYRIAVASANLFINTVGLKIYNHAVPGAAVIDDTLLVVGTTASDTVRVTPVGAADDGSTGVKVRGTYDGEPRTDTLAQPIAAAEFFLTNGDDTADLAESLAFHVEARLDGGDDTFRGGRGHTVVWAGDGNNSIRTGTGVDWVFAGTGNNVIATGAGDDRVAVDIPGEFDFTETAPGTGANAIDTGDGNDRVEVRSDGSGAVTTGAGNDRVVMIGYGDDVIRTGDGNDFVDADAGSNAVFTGAGNDTITAGRTFLPPDDGVNLVSAGPGNDRVTVGSNGPSVVYAGSGNDNVVIGFRGPSPYLTGSAVVYAGDGDDVVIGGGGDDRIYGGTGRDILVGGLGADVLVGGDGSDVLFDGTVRVAGGSSFAPPNLRPVFAAWNPDDPATYAAVRAKLVVTPDTASADRLLGGIGTDWFWSSDALDLLDITGLEVKN